jgi:hypothetical protein
LAIVISRVSLPARQPHRPDNTYEILINDESVKKGSLLEDFDPPVNPPSEIDDPTDVKPADWVDVQQIPDMDAVKVRLAEGAVA